MSVDKPAVVPQNEAMSETENPYRIADAERKRLAERLKFVRTLRGFTRRGDFARWCRELGIRENTMYQYETARCVPRADRAAAIADFAKVDLRWLITGEGSHDVP